MDWKRRYCQALGIARPGPVCYTRKKRVCGCGRSHGAKEFYMKKRVLAATGAAGVLLCTSVALAVGGGANGPVVSKG